MHLSMPALRRLLAAFLFTCVALSPVVADEAAPVPDAVAKRISETVEQWTRNLNVWGRAFPVESVRATPLDGIYEVRISNSLLYVDESARFIFLEGDMIDMRDNRNITRDRLDEILAIDFSALPFDLALKQVVGKGTRRIALFEDPNCVYCRKLRADLARLDDVTIYTFVFPILSPDSETKARKAWCAPDRVKAWTHMMMTGAVPGNDASCDTPIEQIRELGNELGISATPTVFFADGRRLQGYAPPDDFQRQLAKHSGAGR